MIRVLSAVIEVLLHGFYTIAVTISDLSICAVVSHPFYPDVITFFGYPQER